MVQSISHEWGIVLRSGQPGANGAGFRRRPMTLAPPLEGGTITLRSDGSIRLAWYGNPPSPRPCAEPGSGRATTRPLNARASSANTGGARRSAVRGDDPVLVGLAVDRGPGYAQ